MFPSSVNGTPFAPQHTSSLNQVLHRYDGVPHPSICQLDAAVQRRCKSTILSLWHSNIHNSKAALEFHHSLINWMRNSRQGTITLAEVICAKNENYVEAFQSVNREISRAWGSSIQSLVQTDEFADIIAGTCSKEAVDVDRIHSKCRLRFKALITHFTTNNQILYKELHKTGDAFPFTTKTAIFALFGYNQRGRLAETNSLSNDAYIPIFDALDAELTKKRKNARVSQYLTSKDVFRVLETTATRQKEQATLANDKPSAKTKATTTTQLLVGKHPHTTEKKTKTKTTKPSNNAKRKNQNKTTASSCIGKKRTDVTDWNPLMQPNYADCEHIIGEYQSHLIVMATSLAWPEVAAFFNEIALPLDLLFTPNARRELGLPRVPKQQEPLSITTSVVAEEGERSELLKSRENGTSAHLVCPIVFLIDNVICHDFRDTLLELVDSDPACADASKSGRCTLRAGIIPVESDEYPNLPQAFPIFTIGKNKLLLSVENSQAEAYMLQIGNPFQEILTLATNAKQREILGLPAQPQDNWKEHTYNRIKDQLEGSPEQWHRRLLGESSITEHTVKRRRNFQNPSPRALVRNLQSILGITPETEDSTRATHLDEIPVAKLNAVISKIGPPEDADYGPHKDGQSTICSPNATERIALSDGSTFPTKQEMIVFTFCLGEETMTAKTKLQHRSGPTTGSALCSQILTGNCCAHVQSPGLQGLGKYHHSSVEKQTLQGSTGLRRIHTLRPKAGACKTAGDLRIVLKAHQEDGINFLELNNKPEKLRQLYHQYRNLTENRLWFRHPEWIAVLEKIAAEQKKEYLPRCPPPPHPSVFVKLSNEEMDQFHQRVIQLPSGGTVAGIRKPPRFVKVKASSRANLAKHRYAVEWGLRNRKLFSLCSVEGTPTQHQPILLKEGKPLLPGQMLYQDELPMKISKRMHRMIDAANPTAANITHKYKNGPDSVHKHKSFSRDLISWRSDPNFDRKSRQVQDAETIAYRRQHARLPKVTICGTGGSARKSGVYGLNARSSRHDDAHYETGFAQALDSDECKALIDIARNNNVFALVVNTSTWTEDDIIDEDTATDDLCSDSDSEGDDPFWNLIENYNPSLPDATDSVPDKVGSCPLSEEESSVVSEESHTSHDDFGYEDYTATEPFDSNATAEDIAWGTTPGTRSTGEYMFIDYFRVESITYRTLTPKQINNRFLRYPGYVQRNSDNVSFLRNGFIDFTLTKAFSFDTTIQMLDRERGGTGKYEFLPVVDDETEIKVPAQKARDFTWQSMNRTDRNAIKDMFGQVENPLPVHWLTADEIVKYLCYRGELKDAIVSPAHPPEESGKESQFFDIGIPGAVSVMLALTMAAAARSNKALSTRTSEKGVQVTPLAFERIDRLPDVQRRKATACANPDHDVITAFFRGQASELIKRNTDTKLTPLTGFDGSYQTPDFTNEADKHVTMNLLLMSVASRVTGNVTKLSLLSKWGRSGMCLPTIDSVEEFNSFLYASKGSDQGSLNSFISKQHANSVPDYFRDRVHGKRRFCEFLDKMSDTCPDGRGVGSIVKLLHCYQSGGKKPNRRALRDAIERAMSQCSNIEEDQSTAFIAHHVIADIESVIPGFAGEVTVESIGFGSGALFGLICLTRHLKLSSAKSKFTKLHNMLIAYMLGLSANVLKILGWRNIGGGVLQSIVTGRLFSMSDTEHICCKIYVCIANCHPSRTISKTQGCWSGYCWPLPDDYEWAERQSSLFSEWLNIFLDDELEVTRNGITEKTEIGMILDAFPHQLKYYKGEYS